MRFIVQNLPVQVYKSKDMRDVMPRWAVVLKEHSRAQLFSGPLFFEALGVSASEAVGEAARLCVACTSVSEAARLSASEAACVRRCNMLPLR